MKDRNPMTAPLRALIAELRAEADVAEAEERYGRAAGMRIAATRLESLVGVEGWREIESLPDSSEVVLFCDARGNRWTQCASAWEIPVCGLPASYWQPLPAPPTPKEPT